MGDRVMNSRALPPQADAGDAVLSAMINRLIEAYDPERIYLFGSTARGDAGPDSDYDLLLIVPDDAAPGRRRSRLAYEALWPVGRAGDIIVMTRRQFESRTRVYASLAATINDEGRVLYDR